MELSKIICLCLIVSIGSWEYSYGCDLDIHSWGVVPFGELPAACDDDIQDECIPEDWVDRDLILRRPIAC
jgi:hypothetical protein